MPPSKSRQFYNFYDKQYFREKNVDKVYITLIIIGTVKMEEGGWRELRGRRHHQGPLDKGSLPGRCPQDWNRVCWQGRKQVGMKGTLDSGGLAGGIRGSGRVARSWGSRVWGSKDKEHW